MSIGAGRDRTGGSTIDQDPRGGVKGVQPRQFIGIGAPDIGDDERHLLRHQPRNEMAVAGEAIELCNDDGRFRFASMGKRSNVLAYVTKD
jgi:hypothetical protein